MAKASQSFIQKNSTVVAAVCIVVLCVSLLIIFWPSTPPPMAQVWFYDLNSEALVTRPANTISPTQSEIGEQPAVRAYVYAVGDCSKAENRELLFIERLTPDAAEAAAKLQESGIDPEAIDTLTQRVLDGTQVRRPGDTGWVSRMSEAGTAIIDAPNQRNMRDCLP